MTISALIGASLLVSGCNSAEERAEERYQSGLSLAEAGDVDRAIVELRNVFELAPGHVEARRLMARLLLEERGDLRGAYGQYLRLAEQFPDDTEALTVLSELAFRALDWEEFDRHSSRIVELAPNEPRVQAIANARAYRDAALSEDRSVQREIARAALELVETSPDNFLLRSIILDSRITERDLEQALVELDWFIENYSDDPRYGRQRLAILIELQDFEAFEDQLRSLIAQFPEDLSHKTTLIRFLLSRQETDQAEAFLRELADASADPAPRVDLIRFLAEVRGPDAARAEIDSAIAEDPGSVTFRVLGAGLDYEAGQTETAIQTMEDVIAENPDTDEASNIRVALAKMLIGIGNEVGARARVEEALATNPANPNALKMRAAWLIEADDTDAAVAALRTALDQSPEDAEAMTLMAQAHSRAGRTDLAREFLSLAVQASGFAPTETLRFAEVLRSEERYLPAEDILLSALRIAPQNVELLVALGQVYLGLEDIGRTDQVIQALRGLEGDLAEQAAMGLEAERINQQSGPEQALAFLEGTAGAGDATLAARVALIRARLGTGDAEGALLLGREILSENPEEASLRAVVASLEAANGNLDAAEQMYAELLSEDPARPTIWLEMSRVRARDGNGEGAAEAIASGLAANPEDPNLMWADASFRERDGDIDGAIAIYEALYARDSNSVIVANNLASLLATYRDDEESLERAWIVARRLRDAQLPPLQDTYGWITHRRGESEDALPYLEAAAAGLPGDPIVQYHLAEVLFALNRPSDALEAYRRAVEVANPADQRPQIVRAREQLELLRPQVDQQ